MRAWPKLALLNLKQALANERTDEDTGARQSDTNLGAKDHFGITMRICQQHEVSGILSIPPLLHGLVVETRTTSITGRVLYSDFAPSPPWGLMEGQNPLLNQLAAMPLIGRLAGIARIAIAIIHIVGHLIAALVTQDQGHLYHAAKGACEALRGVIEAIPLVGDIFSNIYVGEKLSWWMIKIYNPDHPDALDKAMDKWERLKNLAKVTGRDYYINLSPSN